MEITWVGRSTSEDDEDDGDNDDDEDEDNDGGDEDDLSWPSDPGRFPEQVNLPALL